MEREPDNNGWTIPDVYSNALWSALAFQPPLARRSAKGCAARCLTARRNGAWRAQTRHAERHQVPICRTLPSQLARTISASSNFKKVTAGTVEALRRNAALDREELDFLWWVQLNRSRLLGRP